MDRISRRAALAAGFTGLAGLIASCRSSGDGAAIDGDIGSVLVIVPARRG